MWKIRLSHNRLIFNMGIPIPGKDGLYIETGPWSLWLLFLLNNTDVLIGTDCVHYNKFVVTDWTKKDT